MRSKSLQKSAATTLNEDAFYGDVGKLIRKARLRRKMTQEGLGEAVSLTRTSITNIERGRQKLLLHTLARIAHALGVATSELLPQESADSDVELARVLEVHPEPEREWIKTILLSATRQGTKP